VKKLLVYGIAALLLMAAGGGGVWVWTQRAQAAPPAGGVPEAEPAIDPADSDMIALDPFLVNLADAEAPRFLRATVNLVVGPKAQAARLAADPVAMARMRSTVLELLTTQEATQLVTPSGKAALRTAISDRASAVIGDAKVIDVLFSDFVVQF
jgi:flagellar FliL protein